MGFLKKLMYGVIVCGISHAVPMQTTKPPLTVKIDIGETFKGVGAGTQASVNNAVKAAVAGVTDALTDNHKGVGSIITATLSTIKNTVSQQNFAEDIDSVGKKVGGALGEGLGKGLGEFELNYTQAALPALRRLSLESLSAFMNMRNALQVAGPIALGLGTVLTVQYAVPLCARLIERYIFTPRPQALLPYAKVGRWDRLKQWFTGKIQPITMVFNPHIKDRLDEVVHKALYVLRHRGKHKKITFDNVLLVGPPGTGKTLFVQLLAEKTNMDIMPITAASLLQKDVGIAYLNQMITSAKNSAYGAIIFIDEADALFVNRDQLPADSEHYKLLNHFLALTSDGSNRYIVVAATNHSCLLDEAMDRRFQDRIDMELPDLQTRRAVLQLYIHSLLLNKEEFTQLFVQEARIVLTDALIEEMAHTTDGLSHAEIKDLVHAIGKKACISDKGIITREYVEQALVQALEKRKSFDVDHSFIR